MSLENIGEASFQMPLSWHCLLLPSLLGHPGQARGHLVLPLPPRPGPLSSLIPEALCHTHLQLLEDSLDEDGAQLDPLQAGLR